MSEETYSTRRRGKIAQCPRAIREEICRRLDDGQQGAEILAWANAQPDVRRLIKDEWEGVPLSDNNLSQWWKGGFLEWRGEQQRVESTQALSEFSLRLAKAAGGSMSEGVVAAVGGKILAKLEGADGDELLKLAASAVQLRGTELDKERLGVARERTAISKERARQGAEMVALQHARFAEDFYKWFNDEEARQVMTSKESKPVKMDKLIHLMFGANPNTPSLHHSTTPPA